MRQFFRRIAALLALCLALTALPPVTLAANPAQDIRTMLKNASDGDTIYLTANSYASGGSTDEPLIIDKAVTIEGGTLMLQTGGIVLGADVTFRNVTLHFSSNIRNAVIANGHALTLENVTAGNHSFNLFCGGLIPSSFEHFQLPPTGTRGEIVIRGNTSLQHTDTFGPGNIYAGNLAMGSTGSADGSEGSQDFDAPANEFDGDAVITVESAAGFGALGTIYACGAQQRTPSGRPSGKVTLPNFSAYTVSGGVRVGLYNAAAEGVVGTEKTTVTYDSSHYDMTTLSVSGVSALAVRSGHLALDWNSDLPETAALSVAAGATLNLSEHGRALTAGSFAGGGSLILDGTHPVTITGSVTGSTTVGVGSINPNGNSGSPVIEGQTYLTAPNAAAGAFTLAPHAARPAMKLRQENGSWIAWMDPAAKDPVLIESFRLEDTTADADIPEGDDPCVYVPMPTEYVDNTATPRDYYTIPLTIRVNGEEAERTIDQDTDSDRGYCYQLKSSSITMWTSYTDDDSSVDALAFSFPDNSRIQGRYIIEVTVPGSCTGGGEELTASAVLTVGTPEPTRIPVPDAKTGLRWTGAEQTGVETGVGYTLTGHTATAVGSYTATATLKDGFCWDDGTSASKSISWSIAKAAGPAAPASLGAAAPTAADTADGKITGTTAEMEYADNADFIGARPCADGETTGLAAKTYYVRVRETATHEAGEAARITVPAFDAPTVTAISVSSTGHKTRYNVGDDLDVTGLTIAVTYSDGSQTTENVTADMVSGFDASRPDGAQVLTIRYEGRSTTYTVRILHVHSWRGDWACSDTHHWHDCAAADCPVSDPAQKSGYAAHAFGDWVVDRAATASQSGSRHRTCAVCGFTAAETIPPTGGGGGSSGGGSHGSSGNKGSTETQTRPDGSQVTVVTRADGTVVTTETAVDGSVAVSTVSPDGASRLEIRRADGTTAVVAKDTAGYLSAEATLAAARPGAPLPIPALPADGVTQVTVHTGSSEALSVSIPVRAPAPGIVALLVHADGSETLLKTSIVTEHGLTAPLPDGATVRLSDRTVRFPDTAGHWAGDAITFAASRELLTGTAPAQFSPEAGTTRAMLLTALARLDDAPLSGGGAWYAPALSWAASRGVSDGSDPNAPVTREQLAVMLYRYAGAPGAAAQGLSFRDGGQIHPYARDAVRWAVDAGILTGFSDGSLRPTAGATRAQAAVMLARYTAHVANG